MPAAEPLRAAPASAASLPNGQRISVVDNETWQFSDASPVDGALTPYGVPGLIPFAEYIEGVDVNDDGQGYAVSIVKAGATLVGHTAGPVRPPLSELKPAEFDQLSSLISKLGPQ